MRHLVILTRSVPYRQFDCLAVYGYDNNIQACWRRNDVGRFETLCNTV